MVTDLAVVLGRRVTELIPAVDEARAAGVLRDKGDRLSFRHPLIRQALYDDIAAPIRPAWHRDAARALAEAGAPIPRVARQLLQAIKVPSPDPLDEALLNWTIDAAPTLVAQAPTVAIELLRQAASRVPASTIRGGILVCRLAEALYRVHHRCEHRPIRHRGPATTLRPRHKRRHQRLDQHPQRIRHQPPRQRINHDRRSCRTGHKIHTRHALR
jgi:hypothetical protein